jgi:hypothetical protein
VLQLTVDGATDGDDTPPDNVVRTGTNRVDVFVGPQEAGTIVGRAMSNTELGFGPRTVKVSLDVVLVPLEPTGPAQHRTIEIRRTGRSETATFDWEIPAGTTSARARLSIVRRNRVLQTGILSGTVDGGAATLTEVVVLFHDFASLDDRSDFDLALVLNHDDEGRAGVVAHRGKGAQQILAVAELEAIAGRLRQQLLAAAFLPNSGKSRDAKMRQIFVEAAVEGASLRQQLGPAFGRLQDLARIQIVTARASWFLPLELVYERAAPDDDAVLCARWTAGDPCGDECFADGDEYGVVCPSAFWGMSRVIERHWVDAVDATAATFLVGASPRNRRKTLPITGALLAASKKVDLADRKLASDALGGDTVVVDGWDAWQDAIADPTVKADLLVVMPHTDPISDTMEVSGTTLRGGRFEGARHVTGTRRGQPVVVLFGCDTSGSQDDPAGWATRFMRARAGVVFATLTMVLNRHAAELSRRLAVELRRADRTAVPVGELVRDFRVAAVRDGLLAALAVTAYGDADWKV